MVEKVFVPHELKTIEVDVEKKIFRVNGEDFGKGCDYFSISCDANNGWMLRMDIHSNIVLEEFSRDTGTLTDKTEYQKT